jgi:uncharacterized membrane protein
MQSRTKTLVFFVSFVVGVIAIFVVARRASWFGLGGDSPPPLITTPPAVATAPAPRAVEPRAPWDPWNDAASRGIDFRAVGNEPGWYLEVDHEGAMRVLWAYGEQQATVPATKPVARGSITTVESTAAGHSIKADIEPGPCNDGMSDQSYPLNVTVVADGTRLRGCGRWLHQPQPR